MIKKILIANRGEIALRIIRTCKEMGISTVAVFSQADKNASFVALADESVCIGPSHSAKSYLNIPRIIAAAEITSADAIHPGYGFLAENPQLPEICEKCNIIFIGPTDDNMKLMGDKAKARQISIKNDIPVVPGTDGSITDLNALKKIANEIEFPVILKASYGGGGKGMRVVWEESELKMAFDLASNEAEKAFGNPAIYLEKFIENPRHIEIQILADKFGNVVHLGERECSIQRNHQKVIEEAPSVVVDQKIRNELGGYAVRLAKSISYVGAGTVEFIRDSNGHFYFMEMNTRIQVEHTITEMITGIDIVKEQIKIADGNPLTIRQEEIKFTGNAIECRINAEDPYNNFRPSPGKINNIHFPGGYGIRVDTFIYPGYFIPTFYDSMIAKIIAYGKNRDEVIRRMSRALDELYIDGVRTNIKFVNDILNTEGFKGGNFSTNFVNKFFEERNKI